MWLRLLKASCISLVFCIALLVLLVFVPPSEALVEFLMTPGTAFPRAYWGGFQEVPLFLLVVVLNFVFYAILFYALLWVKAQRGLRQGK
jgi:hypothetical protein